MTNIHHSTTQKKWNKLAVEARADASTLPPGKKREALLERAQQLDACVELDGWLTGELRAPN